ncbi:MAG TPA: VWA domain-containing protein [Gemmataceae bacterium]|nr:VWA domain-containing protein [Gemmataceae bacterium]
MRTRHRIPNVFNISMVDVLCCALGCVILLWMVSFKIARKRAERVGDTSQQLAAAEQREQALADRLKASEAQVEEAARREADYQARMAALERRAADTADARDAALSWLADLAARNDAAEKALARQSADARALEKKLKEAQGRIVLLETQLRDRGALAGENARRADDLAKKLEGAMALLKQLRAEADRVPGLRDDLKSARGSLAAERALADKLQAEVEKRLRELAEADRALKAARLAARGLELKLAGRDKELAAARADLESLFLNLGSELSRRQQELADAGQALGRMRDENKALRAEVGRARAAAENRFAGIELTGRRVVFLVDMSGSMELVDQKTEAPNKWRGVRETLAQIMKSLPDLQKFQVIVFSEKATYLLGRPDEWIDYEGTKSIAAVVRGLAAIKPTGGTNMYAALEAAFRYRPRGLDTIYLLSDGLPNAGEGLTAEQQELKETERAEILGKHIRRTLQADWNRPGRGGERVRINAVGFFFESPDVGAFLWALARENDGSFVGMSKP